MSDAVEVGIGSLVCLKTGGYLMTVSEIEDREITADYFDSGGHRHREVFEAHHLDVFERKGSAA